MFETEQTSLHRVAGTSCLELEPEEPARQSVWGLRSPMHEGRFAVAALSKRTWIPGSAADVSSPSRCQSKKTNQIPGGSLNSLESKVNNENQTAEAAATTGFMKEKKQKPAFPKIATHKPCSACSQKDMKRYQKEYIHPP